MKKGISLFLVSAFVMIFFAACGKSLNVDKSTVYVQKKGKITGVVVENFEKDYYDEAELETYINNRVQEYTATAEAESVKVESFAVKNKEARLVMNYADDKNYAAFNEVEFFEGTVPEAMAQGYDFKTEFLAVEDGETKEASAEDFLENGDYKVVILNEKIDVKVDGSIAFISKDYTSVTEKDTVSITIPEDAEDGEALSLIYIIYK